jgi:UDP-glucuronate decarboxylase
MMRMMATGPEVTGPINIGNPSEFTIRQLAELVVELTGSRSKLIYQKLPSDDPKQRKPDIAKARATLGWEPTIPLHEGLTKTIAYFDEMQRKGDSPPMSGAGRAAELYLRNQATAAS